MNPHDTDREPDRDEADPVGMVGGRRLVRRYLPALVVLIALVVAVVVVISASGGSHARSSPRPQQSKPLTPPIHAIPPIVPIVVSYLKQHGYGTPAEQGCDREPGSRLFAKNVCIFQGTWYPLGKSVGKIAWSLNTVIEVHTSIADASAGFPEKNTAASDFAGPFRQVSGIGSSAFVEPEFINPPARPVNNRSSIVGAKLVVRDRNAIISIDFSPPYISYGQTTTELIDIARAIIAELPYTS